MPRRREEADVVIVGLGAAGGVAALPLARAGLSVVGLEAGTWLDRRDFIPDEIRNNVRRWPFLVKKSQQERPTVRNNASQTAIQVGAHPMDECGGRDIDPLLGPELAFEPLGTSRS